MCVRGAVIGFGRADPLEGGRRGDARGTQVDISERRCGDARKVGDTEAATMDVKCEGFFLRRHTLAFAPPSEDLETCWRHIRFPPIFDSTLNKSAGERVKPLKNAPPGTPAMVFRAMRKSGPHRSS